MEKNRVEAFSDGVIAIIIITIMVLELKVPQGSDLATLKPVLPVFLIYLLSFIYVGIYWIYHHHYHHHGFGAESAAGFGPRNVEAGAAGLFDLPVELHLCRDLLEQPSSSAQGRAQSEWGHDVGESPSAVLAVALPLRH